MRKSVVIPSWANIFLPEGKPPELGDILVQRDLGKSLRQIAAGGREAFYGGEIASRIIRTSEQNGGYFSAADFDEHCSRWEEPLRGSYRGYEICVPPPNSFGLLLLLQLKFLAGHDLAKYRHNTPECVGLQVKAKDEAWSAGQSWIGDPVQYQRQEILELVNGSPAVSEKTPVGATSQKHGTLG